MSEIESLNQLRDDFLRVIASQPRSYERPTPQRSRRWHRRYLLLTPIAGAALVLAAILATHSPTGHSNTANPAPSGTGLLGIAGPKGTKVSLHQAEDTVGYPIYRLNTATANDPTIGAVYLRDFGGVPPARSPVTINYPNAHIEVANGPQHFPTNAAAYFTKLAKETHAGTVTRLGSLPAWIIRPPQTIDGRTHIALYTNGLYIQVIGSARPSTVIAAAASLTATPTK